MHISLAAQTLFYIGNFPVTNSVLTVWIVSAILILVALIVGGAYQKLPGGAQSVLEMVYGYLEDLAVSIGGEKARDYTPLAVCLFLFILLSNWIGLLPGVGSIGMEVIDHGEKSLVPFIRSGTADLNMTLALAVVSVFATQYLGVKSSGILNHLKHFINPMEIVSEVSKILSFSFRLFGNVFAGEVLLTAAASMLYLVTGHEKSWYGVPGGLIQLPFFGLEILVGLIQAFIFASLTLVFISVFTAHEAKH